MAAWYCRQRCPFEVDQMGRMYVISAYFDEKE